MHDLIIIVCPPHPDHTHPESPEVIITISWDQFQHGNKTPLCICQCIIIIYTAALTAVIGMRFTES